MNTLKNSFQLPSDPEIIFLSYLPKINENIYPQKDLRMNIYADLFIIAPNEKSIRSTSEWKNK